jgi:hypothetical protein
MGGKLRPGATGLATSVPHRTGKDHIGSSDSSETPGGRERVCLRPSEWSRGFPRTDRTGGYGRDEPGIDSLRGHGARSCQVQNAKRKSVETGAQSLLRLVAASLLLPYYSTSAAQLRHLTNHLSERPSPLRLDRDAAIAYPWSCAAQQVRFFSSCARRSDDTEARREARQCVGRSDRRAQRQPWLLRSIRPTRAATN